MLKKIALLAMTGAALGAAVAYAGNGTRDVYSDGANTLAPRDVYTDGGKATKFDVYTDGAKSSKFDVFTDGAKSSKFDVFTDGARVTDRRDAFTDGGHL
ncbi:hypothetical protein P3W85_24640 [Cupriavidus basilensis]|uniref:Uncharacterized protein n=1 Tax=Cupriavidus basilensis TaxID=68895 RepID=A0ABT6AU09_9BURK|nr:hypothetical protein [Cupriavidus basilensis]MDF3836115.1 hypothetical protein [Cupriavidus basilensis]